MPKRARQKAGPIALPHAHPGPAGARCGLRAQINAFVEQHLADPAMSPQAIADAHHISLRHLQQLLAEDGTSRPPGYATAVWNAAASTWPTPA
ncbi:hypothetical protein ACWY4P_00790 [Streptomyces sp. LZ34]